MIPKFYNVLLHHPVTNRHGELVTTAVTNMDIHDISRTTRTYGGQRLFLVTPIPEQHELVGRILGHWRSPESFEHHPDRVNALNVVRLAKDFEEVKNVIRAEHEGQDPCVVLTSAKKLPGSISYSALREEWMSPEWKRPVAMIFGTGWGVSETFFPAVDRFLAPIYGPEGAEGYNHLSVRAATAIVLDRLFGQ